MRWSIKYKLPLMSLLLFLLVGLSMLSYQHFFILGSGRQSLQTNQENLDRISIEVSRGISDRYPHLDQIIEYIKGTAQTQSINISVYELNKEIVFQAKYQNDENDRNDRNDQNNQMFRIKSHDIVFANGKATYLVEIENSFGVKEILGLSIVENFVFFTLTVLSIILLWLVVYLHYDIVKPLSLLQKSFGLVGYSKNQLSFLPQKRNDEIGDLSAGFEKMVMNLGDSYNQQLEMISSISHDLKTPLTSIMGYIERLLISNIKTEEKKREYYQIIYQKAEDIEKLIEEFSNYTDNELECAKLKPEKVVLKDFFLSLCYEYANELQAYHTEFLYICDISENAFCNIDVGKIRRVMANLISNSLKYASDPRKITMSGSSKKGFAYFTVEDNGKGIPENELSNIFNKFYRADKSRSSETGGTGLGLAICKSIVESHNGSISAFNKLEGGFVITFILPLINGD